MAPEDTYGRSTGNSRHLNVIHVTDDQNIGADNCAQKRAQSIRSLIAITTESRLLPIDIESSSANRDDREVLTSRVGEAHDKVINEAAEEITGDDTDSAADTTSNY